MLDPPHTDEHTEAIDWLNAWWFWLRLVDPAGDAMQELGRLVAERYGGDRLIIRWPDCTLYGSAQEMPPNA